MTVAELEAALFHAFPRDDAEDWDRPGRSVGDPEATVGQVACALDATAENVARAADTGANVLVAHHPVFLEAPRAFAPRASAETTQGAAAVFEAARRGVAIISMHTNLDRSHAARKVVLERLGLSGGTSLEHSDDPTLTGFGALTTCPDVELGALVRRAADAFDTVPRVWGDPHSRVGRVAFLGGSLGNLGEYALRTGAQAIICGEGGYHVCQDLLARGCAVVLLGHDASELPFAGVLADAVEDAGVARGHITILEEHRQWWSLGEGGAHDDR